MADPATDGCLRCTTCGAHWNEADRTFTYSVLCRLRCPEYEGGVRTLQYPLTAPCLLRREATDG